MTKEGQAASVSCHARRAVGLMVALLNAASWGCGSRSTDDSPAGSETHFLSTCSDRCDGDLECISGVCTRSCDASNDCSDLSANASCLPSGAVDSCQVQCQDDSECGEQNGAWSCSAGRCERTASVSDPVTTPEPANCPDFPAGVMDPVDVETRAELIPDSAKALRVAADSMGVYWVDTEGAVYAYDKSTMSTSQLVPAPPDTPGDAPRRAIQCTGIVTTEEQVYWAEAVGPDPLGLPSADPPGPPARLWTASKATGETERQQ